MILRKRSIGSLLLVLLFIIGPLLFYMGMLSPKLNPVIWFVDAFVLPKQPANAIPPTMHIVLFKFKDSATPIQIKDITSKMLGLKKSCIHPSTRTPYIKSITGGKDNSIENLQVGTTHAFVVRFDTNEDRNYYVDEDPVHQAFKDSTATFIEKAIVVDFQEGVFTRAETEA